MSDFEQAWEASGLCGFADKDDFKYGWDAAIVSMQGDGRLVGYINPKDAGKYDEFPLSVEKRESFQTPVFTSPSASAEIARLTKELEEARKDAERLIDLLVEAKAEIQECLDDHCNMMETKPHRPAIWQQLLGSIDAAISKIGGGE